MKNDPVNRPQHYTFGSIEVIDALEAWALPFHEANVVKYVARARHKGNELEDLRKARWYLDRIIRNLEAKQEVPAEKPKKRKKRRRYAGGLTHGYKGLA
jgi:hypothetical protein